MISTAAQSRVQGLLNLFSAGHSHARRRWVRRRERVIRIFPNEASAVRLVGALLAEQHETWLSGRRYFDMESY